MKRRGLMAGATAMAVSRPAPWAALAQSAVISPDATRTLRVIPQASLTSLDPVWTTAVVTRNHGYLSMTRS